MNIHSLLFCAVSSCVALASVAHATTGESTYNAVCTTCHTSGVAGAPKLGDKKAWNARILEGQAVLTAHAYVGQGAMPPKGGSPNLALDQFAAAVVFIANRAGASWKEPDQKMLEAIRAEIVKRENQLAAKKPKK